MKTRFLLPHKFKLIGWIVFLPMFILGLVYLFMESALPELNIPIFALYANEFLGHTAYCKVIHTNVTPSLIGTLLILGAICLAFSKEKNEDEYIGKIRLESLVWATYVNYAFLCLALVFVWGIGFFTIMVFNMFTLLLFFIIRFNLMLYKLNRSSTALENEESD